MAIEDEIIETPDEETESPQEGYSTAQEKLQSELKKFKGGGKEGAIASHVADTLTLFCKNERFAEAVLANKGTLGDCLKKIVSGVGNSISDLEVYQRAAAYYFPNAKISFSMNIDVDGVAMPVHSEKVVANIPAEKVKADAQKPVETEPVKLEAKRITVDLSEFF